MLTKSLSIYDCNILCAMMLCVFLSVVVVNATADFIFVGNDTAEAVAPFRKCCLAGEGVLKFYNKLSVTTYECMDHENFKIIYNVSFLPLIIGKKYFVQDGFPDACEPTELFEVDVDFSTPGDFCVDKVVVDIFNDTLHTKVSRVIMLRCVGNSDGNTTTAISDPRTTIALIHKCCPDGQSYDVSYHVCRDDNTTEYDEWLIMKLEAVEVYEVEHDMRCRAGHYGIEFREPWFELRLSGDELIVKGARHEGTLGAGEWCVERELGAGRLVARGCTTDCGPFGAYCVRKCCPMNYHYQPFSCNSTVSRCVPDNNNASGFDLSPQLNPLKSHLKRFSDTLGIRAEPLHCAAGKYALRQYFLTENAELAQYNLTVPPTGDYCLETFDYTFCGDTLHLDTLLCFDQHLTTKKNFYLSFVALTVSCVFMALTLLVYGILPELQNLHGKTLMSHVSAMLLGYGCLARVNLQYVPDKRFCAVLGYGVYFGFVAAFAWLNVMCLDIWWTFGSVQSMRKSGAKLRRFAWYSLHAWGAAIALTVIMLLLDLYPVSPYLDANIGVTYCWFGSLQNSETDWPHYIFFVIPMGIVTCTNLVLWILTARHCARVRTEVHRLQAGSVGDRAKCRFRVNRQKYVLTGKLWIVMGAGWVWEVASTFTTEPYWFWTTVDLINSLQGVFIFVILVLKPKVYFLIKKRLGLEKENQQKKGTSSSGRTSTTLLSRTISAGGDERVQLRTSVPNQKAHAA